jgi:hypothetical protein
VQILKYLEENSSLALDTRRKERERKRNRRMTMVLSCIALTFAVIFSPALPHSLFFAITITVDLHAPVSPLQ